MSGIEKTGRIPPHDSAAERSVLGAILLSNDSIHRVVELGLLAEDFYHVGHQRVFDALLSLSSRNQPLDLISLSSTLKDRGIYDEIGGHSLLTALVEDTFAISNLTHYTKIVKNKALLRRLIDTASDLVSQAFEGVEDVEGFLDECETRIFAVSDVKTAKSFTSVKEILIGNMHTIEESASRTGAMVGLPTGFIDFDRMTSGLQPGQLIVVGGRPSMGKSSIALCAAQHAAVTSGGVVAVFSLEMSKEELGMRLLSGLSRIDSKRIKVGKLQERDWPVLTQAADKLSKAKLFIDDSGDLTVMDMRARCRRLQSTEKRLDLVVVDYLQLMRGTRASQRGESSREREISEISRNLKALAKELKVPIIALSQLSRSLESRQDKRPMLSDLRESGAIEQDADIVTFVYRDEWYNKDSEAKGIAEFIIAKHRAGETGKVDLAWLGEYTLFTNLAHDAAGTQVSVPHGRPGSTRRGDVSL